MNQANSAWRTAAVAAFFAFVAVFAIGDAIGAGASFPVDQTELASPDGKMHIKNVDPLSDDQPHKLILSALWRAGQGNL